MYTLNTFSIILHLKNKHITKILSMTQNDNNFDNKYLWKSIYIRNEINIFQNSYYDSHMLPNKLNNILKLKPSIGFDYIKYLPNPMLLLIQLKELTITYNDKIINLPTEIALLTNLTRVNADRNKLINICTEIGLLKNLKSLSFQYNQITNIPNEINQLLNLTYFSIRENQICFLPSDLLLLCNLNSLNISKNKLEFLPKETRQRKWKFLSTIKI